MVKEKDKDIFSDNLLENIGYGFLYACAVGLTVAFLTTPFIDIADKIWSFFDKNALSFVENPYEPFRVGLEAGFLGSFLTTILFLVIRRFSK